jgi:hypothetical protein
MKTITECESKHCKAWPLFSLVCAGVIATFMAGCAEAREIPEYHSSSYYYPTGNSVGNQARGKEGWLGLRSLPGWGWGQGVTLPYHEPNG